MAIPLFLGGQRLGALIAGQAFVQYPQPLALQRVAKDTGVLPADLWAAAVHQVPISHSAMRICTDLLASLGRAFLRQRYAVILERQLHQMNERYRLMIEGSKRHAIITLDSSGVVTSWNPGAQQLLGYSESEIQGQNYSRLFTLEDVDSGRPEHGIRMTEQTGWFEEECWQVRKDGSRFICETVTARLGEGSSREYGRLLTDVTDERKSAEALLQAQKFESIGVLAGGVAHDFNNLLTGILGNVTLALADMRANDPSRPLLDVAERLAVKAAELTAQLLAYAGKGEFVVTRFDLSRLVSEMLPLVQTSIAKTVQIDSCLPAGLPWIQADSTQIQQIVMNLVINGAEAMGSKPGVVRVSTGVARLDSAQYRQPDGLYIEVRDSGCGMDEATRAKIFDPFFTTKFTGRGLGLAAVSGIVRRLRGTLHLQTAPGEGSTFRLVFPAAPIDADNTKPPAQSDQRADGIRTILIVDDSAPVRGLARAVLEKYGYSVLIAENGLEGVEIFSRNADTITAVLLNLTMPVMGGAEAFNRMIAIRPDIPVIISTGYGDTAVYEQFSGAIAGFIQKPYTVSVLRDKVAAILALRSTQGFATTQAKLAASSILPAPA